MASLSIILAFFFIFILLGVFAEFGVIRKGFDNKYVFLRKYIPYFFFFHLIQVINGLLAFGLFNLFKGEKSWNHMSDQFFSSHGYKYEGIALIIATIVFMCGNYLQHKYIWSETNKVNTYFFTLPSQLLGLLILLFVCVFSGW